MLGDVGVSKFQQSLYFFEITNLMLFGDQVGNPSIGELGN